MNKIILSKDSYRCRLCLKVSSDVINIFREDFPKMIKILTSIQVQQTDEFPKVACFTCTRKVKSAMVLRKQILRSHMTLTEEALVTKTKTKFPTNITITRVNCVGSPKVKDNNKNKSSDEKDENVSPEVDIVKVEDDKEMEDEEEIIVIHGPETESSIISGEKQINNELHEKEFLDLTLPLRKNDISIVRVDKSKSGKPKFPLKPKPVINKNLPMPIRSNPKIVFRSAESPKRRGPKPKRKSNYDPLKKVPCKICQKAIQVTNMKKHVESHDKKIVTCQLCGKVTTNISLRAHIFYFHKCKEDEYVCDQCGRHFRIKSKFKLHMKKEHGGTRDFECTLCGKKFFEKRYLNKHVNGHHKKIRNFVCDTCGKDFSSKNSLRVHFRQHSEIPVYKCETCGKGFKQNVCLKNHLKQAHDICEEETVICELCGKGFGSKGALISHSRLHERKKCKHCSEVFVNDEYLERHIREKHKKVYSENDEVTIAVDKIKEEVLEIVDNALS